MSDEDSGPGMLQSVGDLLGVGAVTKQLVAPILAGVGVLFEPWNLRRDHTAKLDILKAHQMALQEMGLEVTSVDLSVSKRAEVQAKAERIVRQANREQIAAAAIENAENDPTPSNTAIQPPDYAWISRFWAIAERVTDEDVQRFFGMVLARRATCRSGLSARALEFLGLLTSREALALQRVASMSVLVERDDYRFIGVVRSIDLSGHLSAQAEELVRQLSALAYSIDQHLLGSIGVLVEGGLVNVLPAPLDGPTIALRVANRHFDVSISETGASTSLGIGIALSPMGVEIIDAIQPIADATYVDLLLQNLEMRGAVVVEKEAEH